MFIELTFADTERKFLLNVMKVEHIETDIKRPYTYLWLNDNTTYHVKESYEQVKALIEHEVQAERGY